MTKRNSTKLCETCHTPFNARSHRKRDELRTARFCSKVCFWNSFVTEPAGIKRCSRCKTPKTIDNFDRVRHSRDGHKSECKSCRRQYNSKVYYAVRGTPQQRQTSLRGHLKSRYGLSVETFNELVQKQNGVCAICLKPPLKGKRLHVDHCHETEQIRGLLCIHCNRALGSLGDDLSGLMRAVRYLERAEPV